MKAVGTELGFSFVALLAGLVLTSVLAGSIYQVLVANERISRVHEERLLEHGALRHALDLMARELREVSAAGGDLGIMEESAIGFRALRAFGLTCKMDVAHELYLTVANHGRPFRENDDVYVFVDGDPATSADDTWQSVQVATARAGETCGEEQLPAQRLLLKGPAVKDLSGRIRQGAVVRSWEAVLYHVRTVRGESYLVREQNGHLAPVVGPLAERDGLEIRYVDAAGQPTSLADRVATARIKLRTGADPKKALPSGILETSVFLRN